MRFRTLFLCSLFMTAFMSCKKDPAPEMQRFQIVKEQEMVEVGPRQATISGSFVYSGTVKSLIVKAADNEQLDGSIDYEAVLDGKNYTVRLEGLSPATHYYYRYEADYGSADLYVSEVDGFTTLMTVPTVITVEVLDIDSTSVRVNCKIVSDGGEPITECGVCWNDHGAPSVSDSCQVWQGGETDDYFCLLTGLPTSTTLYVRAYAKNSGGVGYGQIVAFQTGSEVTAPVVATLAVDSIGPFYALCLSRIVSTGGSPITECGVCWSFLSEPTISSSHVVVENGALGDFRAPMRGLTPTTNYYVRAYAVNSKGISYGEMLEFVTLSDQVQGLNVTTMEVTNVTATSAVAHGTVTDDTGEVILERGVCLSEAPYPSINNRCFPVGSGVGNIEVTMDSLAYTKDYYVRAYAKTRGQGVVYGDNVLFRTPAALPVVRLISIDEITESTAHLLGELVDEGGAYAYPGGFCWGLNPNPTVADHYAPHLDIYIDNLIPGTTYHVRACAQNSAGVGYSNEMTFTTLNLTPNDIVGSIGGLFSISETEQVMFSQGNLQYQASTNTWRFAEHQWDIVGEDNVNISPTYNGWIDLFGWGTSNNDHGAVCYQPWSLGKDNDYDLFYAYGDSEANLEDYTGMADWGRNLISNGGNDANVWRTLTNDEWNYLRNRHLVGSFYSSYSANVNGVNGKILLPDNWSSDVYSFVFATGENCYESNIIDAEQWSVLESYGAVFLPAGGRRRSNPDIVLYGPGIKGCYWSSTIRPDDYGSQTARCLQFDQEIPGFYNGDVEASRPAGCSVRLVTVVPAKR